MNYTPIPSSPELVRAGLPYSVARIEPRTIVAAFSNEKDALAYCNTLNGVLKSKTEPPETKPGSLASVAGKQ